MPKLFNYATNKQGLFEFGGEASSDYGMVVSEAPTFERPVRKATVYNIPGRNGAIIKQQDAWEDVTRTYKVWLTKKAGEDLAQTVDAIEAWLNSKTGYTRLEDSFEPDKFRLAYFNGGASISNEMTQYGTASLSFICRPERFYKSGEQEIELTGNDEIYNPTRFNSKPLLHIEGSGSVIITGGGQTMTVSLTDYINIDCDRMTANREPYENKNADITGDFIQLLPGVNTITLSGTVTAATITPRFFTI